MVVSGLLNTKEKVATNVTFTYSSSFMSVNRIQSPNIPLNYKSTKFHNIYLGHSAKLSELTNKVLFFFIIKPKLYFKII